MPRGIPAAMTAVCLSFEGIKKERKGIKKMGQPDDSLYHSQDTMTLDLDDGSKVECIVVNVFTVNDRQYIALLPMSEDGSVDDDAQVWLYRFTEMGEGDVQLDQIEDDEEYDLVSDYFDELLDAEEFDSLFGDN